MKKLICLILGMMICAGCFSGLAENAETSFLQIKETVTAKVYANPGDAAAIDTLKGGSLCGLLEETTEAGTVWYLIFYLSDAKKGQTGYIRAEDAEKLSEEALTALLEDPDKLNQVLDLIDAVNDYLKIQDAEDSAGTDAGTNGNSNGNRADGNTLKEFYANAMEKLRNVLSALSSVDLSKATDAAREIGDELRTAGKDLLDQAKDELEDLDLKDKLEEASEKLQDIDLQEKLEEVKDKLEDIDLQEKLEEVKDKLEDSNLSDRIDELKDKLEESGLDEKLEDLQKIMEELELKDKVTDLTDHLIDGVQSTVSELQDQDSDLRNSFRSVAEAFSSVRSALGELFGNRGE